MKGPWTRIRELDEAAKKVADTHEAAKKEAQRLLRKLSPAGGIPAVKP